MAKDKVGKASGRASAKATSARLGGKLGSKPYERELARLHVEMVKLQIWVVHKGLKVCIVFEGRDGAGKGGVIKAITERVSPRVFRVVALPAPTEREKSQMYLQRYIRHLPAAGEIVIFDRSWYNRAGVERVMGFCTQGGGASASSNDAGIRKGDDRIRHHPAQILARGEPGGAGAPAGGADQRRPQDLEALADGPEVLQQWYDYSRARDEMFAATDTSWAPWYVVRSDDKKRARLNVIAHLLSKIPYEDLPREKVKLPKRKRPRAMSSRIPL